MTPYEYSTPEGSTAELYSPVIDGGGKKQTVYAHVVEWHIKMTEFKN